LGINGYVENVSLFGLLKFLNQHHAIEAIDDPERESRHRMTGLRFSDEAPVCLVWTAQSWDAHPGTQSEQTRLTIRQYDGDAPSSEIMPPNLAPNYPDSIDYPLKSYIECGPIRPELNSDGTAPRGRSNDQGKSIAEVADERQYE
jgi:hypothetical protein